MHLFQNYRRLETAGIAKQLNLGLGKVVTHLRDTFVLSVFKVIFRVIRYNDLNYSKTGDYRTKGGEIWNSRTPGPVASINLAVISVNFGVIQ